MVQEVIMRKFLLSIFVFTLLATLCAGKDQIKTYLDHGKPKTYGSAPVKTITKVGTLYSFSCDVTGWPAIIGEDVPVNIAGVTFPDIVAKGAAPNKYFQAKLKERLQTILKPNSKAVKIELKNIKRAKAFGLIADVMIDGKSIADILIAEGLAAKLIAADKISENSGISEQALVASKTSKIFHKTTCRHAKSMDPAKAVTFTSIAQAERSGRRPCKTCKP